MRTEEEIRSVVRERYGRIAETGASCCAGSSGGAGEATGVDGINLIGDAYRGTEGYLEEADLGLGCGLPVRHAAIRPGETVLDLGSGAGIDAFVARRETGEGGRVIGVDMTPAMIERARANAARLGHSNVEFRLGEIEHLPVETGTVDLVISNCVLNLVPDKARAFAEAFRVLRPGGRFCISDVVATGPLPDSVTRVAALHVGCVAGAIPEQAYRAIVETTGFEAVAIVERKPIELPDAVLAMHLNTAEIAAWKASGVAIQSVTLTGRKPATQA